MRRKSRVSVSLSDEVIEEVERRRGLVKRSTYYESLLRKTLGMEPEENMHVRRRGIERWTYLK
jgi:Arc/MetJ family transcription regulator